MSKSLNKERSLKISKDGWFIPDEHDSTYGNEAPWFYRIEDRGMDIEYKLRRIGNYIGRFNVDVRHCLWW